MFDDAALRKDGACRHVVDILFAQPWQTPQVVFFPTRLGSYELACAKFCGIAR